MASAEFTPFLKKNAKALCHLNHAFRTSRLGLILGAGVSRSLHIPDWPALIRQLETQLQYPTGKAPETYRAEQLFQHYKTRKAKELGWEANEKLDAAIVSGWREIVARCLYTKFVSANGALNERAYKTKIKKHPYLLSLGRLAQHSVLVVTHNFDDALELAIDIDPLNSASIGRRYHTFWKPEPFLRLGMVNIYHPNGYTPLRANLRGSENLVLTEGGFADHLANTNTEEAHFLLRHLADKTFLIIGHSLADGTLKNALRQHANQRPAHVNYYVHWTEKGEENLSEDQRNAIRQANFETYNLITIFANSAEIAELVEHVSMKESDLEGVLASLSLPSRYVYYIVGAVSSGKSTTLRHLRDLATVEEWPAQMPTEMNRQSVGLKETTSQRIDRQLEDAIWRKNAEIRQISVGMVAVDRAPLDFMAFPTKKSETIGVTARKRTEQVLGRLAQNNLRDLCLGQVIVLQAAPPILAQRQLRRGGRTTPEQVADGSAERYLRKQQELLGIVYKSAIREGSVVSTDGYPPSAALKAVARIIHLCDYTPFPFAERLHTIRKGK